MHDYRRLRVYEQALCAATLVYRTTDGFPQEETYGLVQQMRRAAVSISSNVAEGAGRGTGKEFGRFVRIARGSACELESQIQLRGPLGLLKDGAVTRLTADVEVIKAGLTNLERSLTHRH